jgi:hypothetical protein
LDALVEEEKNLTGKWTRRAAKRLWSAFGFARRGYATGEEYLVFLIEMIKAQLPLRYVIARNRIW